VTSELENEVKGDELAKIIQQNNEDIVWIFLKELLSRQGNVPN
jgi:hypothetical protein